MCLRNQVSKFAVASSSSWDDFVEEFLVASSISASNAVLIVAKEGRFGGGGDATSGWVSFASSMKLDFSLSVDFESSVDTPVDRRVWGEFENGERIMQRVNKGYSRILKDIKGYSARLGLGLVVFT